MCMDIENRQNDTILQKKSQHVKNASALVGVCVCVGGGGGGGVTVSKFRKFDPCSDVIDYERGNTSTQNLRILKITSFLG